MTSTVTVSKRKKTQNEYKVQSTHNTKITSQTTIKTRSEIIGFETLENSHQQIILAYGKMQALFQTLEIQIKEKRNLDQNRFQDSQLKIQELENELQMERQKVHTPASVAIVHNDIRSEQSSKKEVQLEQKVNTLTVKCEDLQRIITTLRTEMSTTKVTTTTVHSTTTDTTATSATPALELKLDDEPATIVKEKSINASTIYHMLPNATGDFLKDSIYLLQEYIAQLDELQLYMHWDTTANDMFGNTECTRAKVNTGRFFALIIANIADYAIDWLGMEEMQNINVVIAKLAKMMKQGYVNPQRIKKELFRFQASDEMTREEYGKHFISLINDPECDIKRDALYDSMSISPSFVHSFVPIDPHFQAMRMITNDGPLKEDLIDETVARIAMAVQSKHGSGMRIGSILLDFNSDQRASIIRQYNRRLANMNTENAFTRDIQSLKGVEKVSKVFLNLLQYSIPELDQYWLTEACKNGKIEAIYEILATRTPSQLKKCVDKSVRQGIADKFGKDVIFVYMANRIMDGTRDTSLHCSQRECYFDSQKIYNLFYSSSKKSSKEESAFMMVYDFLCDRSWAHIRHTAELYLSMAGVDLEQDMVKFLKKEKNKKLAVNFAAMIMQASRDIIAYFAQVLTFSMSGMGMRHFDFNRVVLSRCEMDLAQINYRFSSRKEYGNGTTVLSWILNESGTNFPVYRSLVLQMFGVSSNAQTSQYSLRHFSLTVCNPTCISSSMHGGKSKATFNADAEIDKCIEIIKACMKAGKTDTEQKIRLFNFLFEMSLQQRCEMNELYSQGGGRDQPKHLASQESMMDDIKEEDLPGTESADRVSSLISTDDLFDLTKTITEQFENMVTRGKKKHLKTWKGIQRILRGCFEPLAEFDAYCIRESFRAKQLAKIGCLLGCRTDDEIRKIILAYKKKYNQNLHQFAVARCKTMNKNTCRDILDNILSGKRAAEDVSNVKPSEVHLDCVSFMSPTKNRSVKMEFVRVLTTRTWKHIRCVNDHYNRMSPSTNLAQFLSHSLGSGESSTILMALLRFSLNPVTYFTDSIMSLNNGDWVEFGRVLISRSELDLKAIDVQFSLKNKKNSNLVTWMENESKNYPQLLQCMYTALLQSRDQYRRMKFENIRHKK